MPATGWSVGMNGIGGGLERGLKGIGQDTLRSTSTDEVLLKLHEMSKELASNQRAMPQVLRTSSSQHSGN